MGRRGAHLKHVVHGSDAGGVEAQRLVERIRVLPRVQREGIDEGAAGCQEAGGRLGGGLSDVQREPDWWVGGMGRRGAHPKHLVHGSDAGGVDVQRLVERVRALPSPKAGIA